MEALEFLKEKVRMCHRTVSGCNECPLSSAMNKYHETCSELMRQHPEEAIMVVEQWSKEHPIITNAMKFKEVFGIDVSNGDMTRFPWWDEPYKEPEHD